MADKTHRGKRSKIHRLPPHIKEALDAFLRDSRMSQQEILDEIQAMCEAVGVDAPSQPGLSRYASQMETVGARIREAREVSKQWIAKLGTAPEGEVSRVLVEMVRTLAFDTVLKASNSDEPIEPKFIKELSIGIEKLEKAASESQKRELEIRKQMAMEAAEAAAEVAASAGISESAAREIKNRILGIA